MTQLVQTISKVKKYINPDIKIDGMLLTLVDSRTTKKNAVRRGVVVWSEGKHGQNSSVQDVVSYAQEVSDSINGYVKMKVSYGSCQIVKTSEDGKVDGINFTITGNGINQTVTTANGGKFQIDNLMPGIYTVTEQAYDKYEPQETHRVTVVAGQVAKVTFNNKLKRGDLQVVKSSEDNLGIVISCI